jgi:tetratricopeptide (TPR) repeat protein
MARPIRSRSTPLLAGGGRQLELERGQRGCRSDLPAIGIHAQAAALAVVRSGAVVQDRQVAVVVSDTVETEIVQRRFRDQGVDLHPLIHARAQSHEARDDQVQASTLDPDELYGSVGLSLVLRQADRLPEATALLRGKLARHPRDATLNYLLADVLLRSDPDPASPESAEARTALKRALLAKPDFAKAHATLGRLQLRAGEVAGAADELRMAVRIDPNDRLALNQLVLAYRRLGQQEDAAAVAGQLKKLVEAERTEEIARNRVRLYRAPAGNPGR